MKNVLIISSAFPPLGGVAAQRVTKFVKYLPSFGWKAIVLTLKKREYTKTFMPLDYSFGPDLPKDLIIYETDHLFYFLFYPLLWMAKKESQGHSFWMCVKPSYILKFLAWLLERLFCPSLLIGWYPYGLRVGRTIIKKHHIDMIFSSSPSEVTHLIARKLAKKYNLPWVADFRDPWVYSYCDNMIGLSKLIDIRMEKSVIASADRLVVLEPGILNEFRALNENFDLAKCFVIHNGYDEQDFQNISPHAFNQFTIVYTGALYKSIRSPYHFLVSLALLFQEHPDLKKIIKVLLIGPKDDFVNDLIRQHNLSECVELLGYVEHKEVISYMCGASILLVLAKESQNTNKPFQCQNVIPAKVYEYLRAGRPILALTLEDSDYAQIIRDTHSGIIVEPTDYQKIKEAILNLYEQYRNGKLEVESDINLIQRYERKTLTGQLAKIFDDLLLEKQKFINRLSNSTAS